MNNKPPFRIGLVLVFSVLLAAVMKVTVASIIEGGNPFKTIEYMFRGH